MLVCLVLGSMKPERLVKQINPNFTVHMYGSSTNGMGFLDSDVDAFVNLLTDGNV